MVSGPVPTELFLEVFLLKRHQVAVRWVEPGAMLLQDVRPEWGDAQRHVSSRLLARTSAREGVCFVETSSNK